VDHLYTSKRIEEVHALGGFYSYRDARLKLWDSSSLSDNVAPL